MSHPADGITKIVTLGVLTGTGISKLKPFTFNGQVFSPDTLKALAFEIDNGTLDILYETKKMKGAIYNSSENRLYIKYFHAGTVTRQALIVHELTHAMYDFQGRKMDVATSEAISYIVQCMYIRGNNVSTGPEDRIYADWDVDHEDFEAYDRVFKEGWRIAGKLLNGQPLDSEDERLMRYAVSDHPEYWMDASRNAGFDGY